MRRQLGFVLAKPRAASLHLFGSVVGETISETVVGALFTLGALAGVFTARAPFVAENFIADDGVDFLRLVFLCALLFDAAGILCRLIEAHDEWKEQGALQRPKPLGPV